ncbi:MAG: hypothetical protein KA797_07915 [Chitinophagales bacterium]|nr:hypothetical protein [Chitinophagales bacterium]
MKYTNQLLIILFFFLAFSLNAQECIKFKQGQHMKMTVYRYSNDEVFMPSWGKMKDSKRDENVAAFNDKVSSGQIKSVGTSYIYDIKSVSKENGIDRAFLSTDIAGKTYTSFVSCIDGVMNFTRIIGANYTVDAKGDTIAFGILGIQSVPNTLKVGDRLNPYEDIMVSIPSTISYNEKKSILTGVRTSTRSFNDIGFDYEKGTFGSGTRTVTETKGIYESIDVKIRETTQFSGNTINYAVSEVIEEEDINIDGVNYKAYRIESETWTKGNITKTYQSSNDEWKRQRENFDEKVKASMTKRGIKKGYTNAAGYVVIHKTEWFVPGIGMVKMNVYDNYGNILSHSILESLK